MRRSGFLRHHHDDYAWIAARLDSCLDEVLKRFPPGLMAELMVYVPDPEYLVSVAIRPDNATVLPTRLRAGEGIAGRVLQSHQPIGGRIEHDLGQPRLLESRSVLVVPLHAGRSGTGQLLGILNLESHDEATLTLQSMRGLEDLNSQIAALLDRFPLRTILNGPDMVRFLLDKVEREIVFILDPARLSEIYHQIRQAAERLTSPPDVVASILLRQREAERLEFIVGGGDGEDETPGPHDWIYPVPNVGGEVNLPFKWDLLAEPSMTREVLETHEVRYLPDVSAESVRIRRKHVPAPYDRGSELNIPVGESEDVFGTMILLSQRRNAFSADDQQVAASLARYLGVITRRIERFLEPQRPLTQEHLELKSLIRDRIDPLYTSDDFSQIHIIRDNVLRLAAHEAKVRTRSEVGGVVLAEAASEGTEELVWNPEHYETDLTPSDEALGMHPFRLPTSRGLVGSAFSSRKPLRVGDVHHPNNPDLIGKYVEAFPGVNSELVIPLQGRNKCWGVIDLESSDVGHYTRVQQHRIELLAAEVVDALEALELAVRRWFENRLSALDHMIAHMRESSDLEEIQRQREPLLQSLIDETCALTGATVAQIYVAVNAYDDTNRFQPEEGALGAVIASPATDYTNLKSPLRRHIKATDGMAGHVMQTGKIDFFKDPNDQPKRYLENIINARSALVAPIVEGARVIGVLNLESTEPRWCGTMQIDIARYAARLASSILVEYKLCMEKTQADKLREFESALLKFDTPDVKAYMVKVLGFANALTTSPDKRRWGQMALIQGNGADYVISVDFTNQVVHETKGQPLAYSVFRRVGATRQPCLVPNLDMRNKQETSHPEDFEHLPWEEAQSLLCVPLVLSDANDQDEPVAIGLLTMASSRPYHLNDGDRTVLGRFTQSVVHGLEDIARLYSRVTLTSELKSEFRIFSMPASIRMEDLREEIRSIPEASDSVRAAIAAVKRFRAIEAPLQLVEHLPQWYLILSNYYPLPAPGTPSESSNLLTLGEIIDSLEDPMDTFVRDQIDSTVVWRWEDTPDRRHALRRLRLTISAEAEEQQILKAAIFGCIAAAAVDTYKGDATGHDIRVMISRDGQYLVRLSFQYVGKRISSKTFSQTPHYRFDQESNLHTVEVPERRLVEVRSIARSLGGEVTINELDGGQRYAIDLLLPCLS